MNQLPELLGVDAVLERYCLRDRRAARRVMDAAGSFAVAGKLYVSAEDLAAYEARLRVARKSQENAFASASPDPASRRRRRAPQARSEPLPADWWRNPPPA